ncbi:extensin -like [Oryza sativa Japonica Group]|uniref:Extensin-like n=1 Tax=Oryza sativa subsp. japonica TaxID=39947 RepID=Q5JNH2_ORYSJ|nr:extensin -like [Oryza sativa Japonica Group]
MARQRLLSIHAPSTGFGSGICFLLHRPAPPPPATFRPSVNSSSATPPPPARSGGSRLHCGLSPPQIRRLSTAGPLLLRHPIAACQIRRLPPPPHGWAPLHRRSPPPPPPHRRLPDPAAAASTAPPTVGSGTSPPSVASSSATPPPHARSGGCRLHRTANHWIQRLSTAGCLLLHHPTAAC